MTTGNYEFGKKRLWIGRGLLWSGLLTFLLGFLACTAWQQYRLPVNQPIPFSHRLHANKKQISCLVCHETADSQARSGVPALETCMLCHTRIIVSHPEIVNLRTHYYQGEPVYWKRINELPDFVFFNHAMHLQRSVDCGHCHGEIKKMDRIGRAQVFEMGFCIECHKTYNVSHDCFTCHR